MDDSDLLDFSKRTARGGAAWLAVMAVYALVYLAIHLWVSVHAYRSSGWLAAVVTFCLPVVGDAYWGIREWRAAGPTTFALAADLGAALGLLSYVLQHYTSRWVESSRATLLEAFEDEDDLEDVELLEDADDDAELTPQHVAILRHVRLGWDGCESGAPCFDPDRPLGDGDFWEALQDLTETASREEAAAVWRGMAPAWRDFVGRATLEPGHYRIRPVSDGDSNPVTEVEVTAEMLTLAQTLGEGIDFWEDDFRTVPGPSCNPKRPYGDFTNYPIDMARALGWDDRIDTSGDYAEISEQDEAYLENLHYTSMLPVMQAILQHGRL